MVVEDSGSLKNIPPVVGLLAYQKDNQSLHVLMNDTWKALAVEEKVYMKRIINRRKKLFINEYQ